MYNTYDILAEAREGGNEIERACVPKKKKIDNRRQRGNGRERVRVSQKVFGVKKVSPYKKRLTIALKETHIHIKRHVYSHKKRATFTHVSKKVFE